MERLLYLCAAAAAMLVVTFGGNAIAQRIYPTSSDDYGDRKFAYRLIFMLSGASIVGAVWLISSFFMD